MKDKKLTTYQMAVTAVMAAVLCVLGPLTVPIGAVPISLANFVICLTAWLLGPKFGTLSVVLYLALGTIGILRLRRRSCQAGRPYRRLSGGLSAAGLHRRYVH